MNSGARFVSSLLLALATVSTAYAGDELYLRWDNCVGDGGAYNKTFACDTNSGVETLVGSFRLDQTLVGMNAIEGYLEIASIDPLSLPSWWQIAYYQNGPECRPAYTVALSPNPPATSTNCFNGWVGNAAGGVAYTFPSPTYPYVGARIAALLAVPAGYEFTALAGQEVYGFTISISHTRTVGLGSCSGCATPVCIAWGHAHLYTASDPYLPWIVGSATPNNGSNVTWQPGAVATTTGTCGPNGPCHTYVTCQSVTPARSPTWGSIKSLYR